MKTQVLLTAFAASAMVAGSASAAVLIDINADNTARDASLNDFEDAMGLAAGALTGSTVTTYDLGNSTHSDPPNQSLDLTVDSIRLEVSDFSAEADNWFSGSNNLLLDDGLYMRNTPGQTTSLVTLSGTGLGLAANTTYDLYLFGGGGSNTTTFNFDPSDLSDPSGGTAVTVGPATVGDQEAATTKYTFTTGAVVPTEIVFSWADPASGGDAALTGIALVPEPGSLALLGLGGLCVLRRRRQS